MEDILNKIKELGFAIEQTYEDPDGGWYTFTRKTKDGTIHKVTIEDHRWEKACEDFDPENNLCDIGDWLIFSEATNDTRDFYGNLISTPYGMTKTELLLFLELTDTLEKTHN